MIHNQIPFLQRFKGYSIFILRHFFAGNTFLENLRKKNVATINKHLLNTEDSGKSIPVTRIKGLIEKDFERNFLNKGLPVIFEGEALGWNCVQKWNLDYLSKNFGDQEFAIIEQDGLTDKAASSSSRKIHTQAYVESLRNGGTDYLRFCPIMEKNAELRKDVDQNWLRKMRKCFLGVSYQSFIGPAGRRTPLHSDTTAFFYIMAHGKKKWWLYSPGALPLINPDPAGKGYNMTNVNIQNPDQDKYPGFNLLQRYTCELNAGDILFVPAWMWHEVENMTESWGVSYRFTSLRGFFQFPAYAIVRVAMTRGAFLKVLYLSFFKSDLPAREENLLTPKIFLDE